ncbi:MAG TPA: CDP-alcohol phosphatidyltransferase family protein [Planctomycetota bacterium]|nr:CDP-alcohol phosphatidyltransferase family protein [Planctomycetota bacterium]
MLKTLADWITATRFFLALALFGVFAFVQAADPGVAREAGIWCAFALFVVAALSDTLDGAVARRTGLSDFGRVADPFVDKVLVVGSLVFLASIPPSRDVLPAWAVVIVVTREFLITGIRGFVEAKGLSFPADSWGKTKMILQCLTVGGGILCLASRDGSGWWSAFLGAMPTATAILLVLTLVLTIVSGLGYLVRAWRFLSSAAAARP